MTTEPTWTKKDLIAISKAIATGVTSVEIGGKRMQYRSLQEMFAIRSKIEEALNKSTKAKPESEFSYFNFESSY